MRIKYLQKIPTFPNIKTQQESQCWVVKNLHPLDMQIRGPEKRKESQEKDTLCGIYIYIYQYMAYNNMIENLKN